MTTIFHLCLFALLFGLASVSLATDAAHLSQEDDIREAIFRYQFEHNASSQQKDAHDYFLSIGEHESDPSDEFMKRFAGHRPPVRKASACRITALGSVINKRTGKSGLLFRVGNITWLSEAAATAYGGYSEGNTSASANTYTVTKENGRWKVIKDEINAISRRAQGPAWLILFEKSPLKGKACLA